MQLLRAQRKIIICLCYTVTNPFPRFMMGCEGRRRGRGCYVSIAHPEKSHLKQHYWLFLCRISFKILSSFPQKGILTAEDILYTCIIYRVFPLISFDAVVNLYNRDTMARSIEEWYTQSKIAYLQKCSSPVRHPDFFFRPAR